MGGFPSGVSTVSGGTIGQNRESLWKLLERAGSREVAGQEIRVSCRNGWRLSLVQLVRSLGSCGLL
jgi:hypothetical protein